MSELLQLDRTLSDYKTIEPKRVVPEDEYLLGGDPKPVPTEDELLQQRKPQVQNVTKFVEPVQGEVKQKQSVQVTPKPGVGQIPNQTNAQPYQDQQNPTLRNDGTNKGTGYFGVLKTKDGRDATEMSIGVEMDGKETEIPVLVPTLSDQEKNYLLNTPIEKHKSENPAIYEQIIEKSVSHARQRTQQGKSPFADVNDYNPQQAQPTGGERIKSIYERLLSSNAEPPKPEFDAKAPEYMKRTARMNALARGLSTLGDAFSLSKGGNVPQPTKDTDTDNYINNYFGYLDKYRKDLNDYRQQDYLHNMRLSELMRQQGNRDEDIEWRNKNFEYGAEQDKLNRERQGKIDEVSAQRAKQDDDFRREQLDWQKQSPYVNHKLMTEREQQKADLALKQAMSKAALDETTGGFNLYDEAGTLVKSIDKGMMNRLVKTILQDSATKELAKNDLNLMKGQFEGLSTNAMNSIIAYYWNQSPEAMKLLGTQEQKPQATGNSWAGYGRPEYQGPVRSGETPITQPKQTTQATTTIDYSTLTY